MIPKINSINVAKIESTTMPNKNYKMDISNVEILGYVENFSAMEQVIYKILNTERYQYIIYSWNYGIELKDLFGKPTTYVIAELERRIKEALVQDDRINNVTNFVFEVIDKTIVFATFTVITIFGGIDIEKEFEI